MRLFNLKSWIRSLCCIVIFFLDRVIVSHMVLSAACSPLHVKDKARPYSGSILFNYKAGCCHERHASAGQATCLSFENNSYFPVTCVAGCACSGVWLPRSQRHQAEDRQHLSREFPKPKRHRKRKRLLNASQHKNPKLSPMRLELLKPIGVKLEGRDP